MNNHTVQSRYLGMQMPSAAQVNSANISGSMERINIGNSSNTSLHNKVANFVLDLQTDVRLEDLLDNNENSSRVNKVPTTQHIPAERKELHVKHLRHLYNEIKNQQNSIINAHEQQGKRRQAENSSGFARSKTMRSSDFLLRDADCLDDTWLLNFASQLGLDKKMDLPELNCDLMQELLV